MIVARSIAQVRQARAGRSRVGFVPTMGALHEGHLSLIDAARAAGAEFIVVSLFVNPTQFAPNEDFNAYPREEDRDIALLESRNVDLLFAPAVAEIYPEGARTTVHVSGVSAPLEGARRPGHFDGVATVVAKLFHIVEPDVAVFGEKDAQQCAVIRQMTRDLDFPIEIVTAPTVREHDGLAMSSRNRYLNAEERASAPALHRALLAGASKLDDARAVMRAELARTPGVELDYLELVDATTFLPPASLDCDLILVGAVRVGNTRLIDNVRIPGGATVPTISPADGGENAVRSRERSVLGRG